MQRDVQGSSSISLFSVGYKLMGRGTIGGACSEGSLLIWDFDGSLNSFGMGHDQYGPGECTPQFEPLRMEGAIMGLPGRKIIHSP